ncbi:MAG TPA: hypothetical protein VE953_28410 [Terriglobales bacterium]|nr:hypothetical protein [Terriglobales bacterium]
MARDVIPAHDGFAWRALAAIMLTNGSLALLAPRWLAGRLGVRAETQPASVYVLRMFGIRTVLVAADLCLEPRRRRRALRQGILMHATDAGAALVAAALGELPVREGLMAAGISTVNTLLCLAGSRRRS